jgi:Anti-sigma factor NepR
MAGRLKLPETSPGTDGAQDRDTPQSGVKQPEHGRNTVIERWLQLHLRQLYEEVSSEPLPSDLSDLIDRFRKRRQEAETGGDTVAPLPPAARQGS